MFRTAYASYLPQINYAVADGNTGGGDTGSQDDPNKGQQADSQNNIEDNVDPFEKMWETDIDKDKGSVKPDQQQQQITSTDQKDDEFVANYVKGLELTKGIDAQKIFKDLGDGDHSSFIGALEDVASRTFQSSVRDMNNIMDQKLKTFEKEIVQKTKNNFDGSNAIRSMNEQLPFTKNSAVAPIAQVILAQLTEKSGGDTDKAVTQVGEFMKHFHKLAAKDLGIRTAPASKPGGGSFEGNGVDEDAPDESEWLKLLSTK